MNTYTAYARREQGWWTVTVAEVDGLFTQARRLDQIPDLVKDALTLFPEAEPDPESAHIIVQPLGEVFDLATHALQLRNEATVAQEKATATAKQTADILHDQGLSYSDIGSLLDVSYQYAQNLVRWKQ